VVSQSQFKPKPVSTRALGELRMRGKGAATFFFLFIPSVVQIVQIVQVVETVQAVQAVLSSGFAGLVQVAR
jgi:hypothetical protein